MDKIAKKKYEKRNVFYLILTLSLKCLRLFWNPSAQINKDMKSKNDNDKIYPLW